MKYNILKSLRKINYSAFHVSNKLIAKKLLTFQHTHLLPLEIKLDTLGQW